MERPLPARRPGRVNRLLAAIGRGALVMAGGAGVLGIGALPSVLLTPPDDAPPPA